MGNGKVRMRESKKERERERERKWGCVYIGGSEEMSGLVGCI